ncbi:MAG TPA: hypothetical protein VHZ53_14660 [Steroidobacteraceae bacterium]|nr:hypothetical protein [Steroidobacteraceae bacterium]
MREQKQIAGKRASHDAESAGSISPVVGKTTLTERLEASPRTAASLRAAGPGSSPAPAGLQASPPEADPHKTHDLSGYHPTGHAGLDQVKALVAHDKLGKPPVARVAELIAEHPDDRPSIFRLFRAMPHLGKPYEREVEHAEPAAKAAHKLDLDLKGFNSKHAGETRDHTIDPNRLAKAGSKEQAALALDTKIYTSDGSPYSIGDAKAGATVAMNAGGAKDLKLTGDSTATRCVMAFYVGPPFSSGDKRFDPTRPWRPAPETAVTGWIPVVKLNSLGQSLAVVDGNIASAVDKQHANVQFSKTAQLVTPLAVPRSFAHLRTAPQHRSAKPDANLPEHYFGRPGDVVNLMLNAPNTGGATRFGAAIDALVGKTAFYQANPPLEIQTPLWEAGTDKLTDQVITFVYGRADSTAGAPSYGWINKELLT